MIDPKTERLAPPSSYYARTPSSMRLLHDLLSCWPSGVRPIKVMYCGCAYGDDLFSWLGVGKGLAQLEWHTCDIRQDCADFVKSAAPEIETVCAPWQEVVDGMQVIIANRVYTKVKANNAKRIRDLLAVKSARLIFARGHYQTIDDIRELVKGTGWMAFVQSMRAEDITPECEGFVFARWDIACERDYITVRRIAERKLRPGEPQRGVPVV